MRKTTISVTEAARNFADYVNRARYQNASFVLLKNGTPVARLVPEGEKICSGRELAEALASTRLSREEAMGWSRDVRAGRKSLKAPADKWR
jgi:prevent-host-death family protein